VTDVLSTTAAEVEAAPEEARAGSSFRWWLLAIAVAAVVGRIVYVLWYYDGHPRLGTAGDPYYYHVQANLLADGHWFVSPYVWKGQGRFVPSAYHPPLYPAYLAVWSVLGATSRLWHVLASVPTGAATVVVVGLLGREMGGARIGVAAAVVAAAYPALWVSDALLMSESLFALTLALVFWSAYRYRRAPTRGGLALLAAMVGLAALTRAEAILLYPFLVLPLVVLAEAGGWEARLRRLGVAVVVAVVVVGPWMLFNTVRFGAFVPLTTSTGDLVAFANCPTTYHGPFLGQWDLRCAQEVQRTGDEVAEDRQGRDIGLGYARRHLGRLPVVVAARIGRTFEVYRPGQSIVYNSWVEQRGTALSRAGQWSYWFLGALSVVGLFGLRRRGRTLVPPLAAVGLVVVTSATSYGFVRLRLPVDVLLCALAPLGAAGLHRLSRGPSDGAPAPSVQGGT